MDDVPFLIVPFRPWLLKVALLLFCFIVAAKSPAVLFAFGIAIDDCPFHLLDEVGHRDATWAGIGAVEDGAAAPDAITPAQDNQAFRASLVAAVEDETVGIYD